MADFTIRVPRVSVAIAEATLVEFLVNNGEFVREGEPLFVIETEKIESEIVAGASGTVYWTGDPESVYPIGAEIGTIQAAG